MKSWMTLVAMVALVGLFSPVFGQDKGDRKDKKQDDGDKKPPEKKDGDKDKKDGECKGLDEKGLLERLIEKMKDKSPEDLKKKVREHMKMHKDGACHCMCDHKKERKDGDKKDGDKKEPPEKKERKEKKDDGEKKEKKD